MVLSRFMPDTMSVINGLTANKTGGSVFVPHCLAVGTPGGFMGGFSMPTTPSAGLRTGRQGAFGNFGVTPQGRHTVWGLYDTSGEPQMFVTIKEYSTTINASVFRYVDAEFAKAKTDAMEVSLFEDDPDKAVATSFPGEAGHALFTWEL
jgi:hypothetical protein